jgi:hypothetical protein
MKFEWMVLRKQVEGRAKDLEHHALYRRHHRLFACGQSWRRLIGVHLAEFEDWGFVLLAVCGYEGGDWTIGRLQSGSEAWEQSR